MEQSVPTTALTIYKYMKPKYADALCTRGAVRIGTLFDYRRDEHLAAVADGREGKDPLFLSYTGVLPSPEATPPIIRNALPQAEGLILDRCLFEEERSADNCYVFSVGLEFSERMLEEFGGACVHITGFSKFAGLITKVIWKISRGGVLEHAFGICTYRGKREGPREYSEHDSRIHPSWIKPLEYDWQREARVMWRMKDAGALEPIDLIIPRLAKHCTRIR